MVAEEGNRELDLFVSYAKKDAFDTAVEVVTDLERRGLKCWIAPRDIPAGASWPAEIAKSIRRSSSFLLLLSAGANASEEIEKELNEAARQRKTLFVIRLADIEPNDGLGYHLNRIQWLDLFRNREAVFNEVAARAMALRNVAPIVPGIMPPKAIEPVEIAISPAPKPESVRELTSLVAAATPRSKKAPILIGVSALALIGMVWAGFATMRNGPPSTSEERPSKAKTLAATADQIDPVSPAPAVAVVTATKPSEVKSPETKSAESVPGLKTGDTKTSDTGHPDDRPPVQPAAPGPQPSPSITPAPLQERVVSTVPLPSPAIIPPAERPLPAPALPAPQLLPPVPQPQTTAPPPLASLLPDDFEASIKTEMIRTACFDGSADNLLTVADMRPALKRFSIALKRRANFVRRLSPEQSRLLNALGGQDGDIGSNGTLLELVHLGPDKLCLLKLAPTESEMPPHAASGAPRRAERPPSRGGGGCFSANGTSFCQ